MRSHRVKNERGKLLTNQTTVIVDITIRKDYIGPGGRTSVTHLKDGFWNVRLAEESRYLTAVKKMVGLVQ
jgi:hypothetical protein